MSEIGEKWDFYRIGTAPMDWFDRRRAPKLVKLFLIFPYSVALLPWLMLWFVLDTVRDLWRSL